MAGAGQGCGGAHVGVMAGDDVTARPGRETGDRSCGRGGEVVTVGGGGHGPSGAVDGTGRVTGDERQGGAVHLDLGGDLASASSSRNARSRAGRVSIVSTCRSRRSMSSNSLLAISPPTSPIASTGRSWTTASGRSSTQWRRRRSRRSRFSWGRARSTSCRRRSVSPGERVAHCFPDVAGLGVPAAGAVVQAGDVAGPFASQVGPQDVCEQVVVAVPAALVVQRDQEKVLPLQQVEHGSGTAGASRRRPVAVHCLTQRSAKPSRIEVSNRNRRTSSGCRSRTSSTR